ncbi:putative nuclease HARBI1 [Leptopilina boulardi]|uniref:putative nuclease HARBI1 n=1 Tax=Leptopilina boulardi TaxID=63433 RepID=UPI0021F520FC|nr:putative nuclease HARBI1 [Leptopilina boulardi]
MAAVPLGEEEAAAAIATIAAVNMLIDDEDEEEEQEILRRLLAGVREVIPKTENFFEEIAIIEEDLERPYSNISARKKLSVALWYFGNQDVYRSICDRFGISKSTGWECVMEVARALSARAPNFIAWPTAEEIPTIARDFEAIAGFPGVIGLIDGSHVRINAPHEFPDSYINRYGFHSINVQGICDSQMRFIDIYSTCPGSVNGTRVYQLSPIREEIDQNYERYFPDQTHLLGDKIYYPVQFNLLPPYKDNGHLTEQERHFNIIHSRTRQMIERSFALSKNRFRRLKCLYVQNIEYASLIILACCILHNICISLNDDLDEVDAENQADGNVNDEPEEPGNEQFNAVIKRRIIAEELFHRRRQ